MDLRPPEDPRLLRPRLQVMAGVVVLAFLVLLGRLCQLQILEGAHYARRAEQNFVDVVPVEAPRGRIFAAGGEPLATNRPTYSLYVTAWVRRPKDVGGGVKVVTARREPMPDAVLDTLSTLVDFADEEDRRSFRARLRELAADKKRGRYPVRVRNNLSWEENARIQARLDDLAPWVEVRESARRFYPEGAVTAFVTGHMGNVSPDRLGRKEGGGYRPGDRVGHTGIERQWENYLRGRPGARPRVVDVRNREVVDPPKAALESLPPYRDPIPGQDIHLTLDLELQRVAWEAFEGVLAGGLVAMDVRTGAILAMVSVPAIDPNLYEQPIPRAQWEAWTNSPLKPFIDKTVQEHFFPGSTYKVVSALTALRDPNFDPEREIECEGYVLYGGRRFRDTHAHGPMNLEQAIVQSCNVYFYTLAMEEVLTLERMAEVARAFGLGERTGLGLNGEVGGRIPTEAFEARTGTYQRGVQLNSAIGQGNVKSTVLQIAVLYAAVANGGTVWTPYIVDRITTHDGRLVFETEPLAKPRPPVDPEDLARVRRGLFGVVNDERGTAYSERPRGILVAGKTGTAQVGREERARTDVEIPGWDTTKDHAWFAAYAPADDPQIVVVALVEHGGVGADAAAPIVMKVLEHRLGTVSASAGGRPAGVPPPLPGRRRKEGGR